MFYTPPSETDLGRLRLLFVAGSEGKITVPQRGIRTGGSEKGDLEQITFQ